MNTIRIEGCLWHALPEDDDKLQRQSDTARFTQLIGQMTGISDTAMEKSALLRRINNRYRLVGGPAAGLVCEIEALAGKTYLKVLVPQLALFTQLSHFSTWLNAGLLAAGHSVILEVVYDNNIT